MRWYPNLQQYRTSLSIAANALDRSATLFKPRSTTAAAIHSKRWSSRSKGFAIGGVAAIGVAGAAAYAIKRRRQSRKAAGHHYQNRPPQLTRQQRQQMARRRRRVRGRFA